MGPPLCLFDLDQTLLQTRTILTLGERFDVLEQVEGIWDEHHRDQELAAGEVESRRIAALFEGVEERAFRAACGSVALRPGAGALVDRLRALGFVVGVVSASYTHATERALRSLGLDFQVGVSLEVQGGHLTGRLAPQRYPGPCGQWICKEAVLARWRDKLGSPFTVAVGDGRNDVCMAEAATLAIGIEPCNDVLRRHVDHVVEGLDEVAPLVEAALREAKA